MVNILKTRFHTWTAGGSGGGGGPTMDIKVKVSATDTTTDYLSAKLVSTDGTATFSILNPAGNEQYDISVGGVETITVVQGQALISGATVIPNRLYLVTDAYGNTAQVFLWGVSTTSFDPQGFGQFTNANTVTPVDALLKYDIVNDKITEVYMPFRNVRVIQSYDVVNALSYGNSVDQYPFGGNLFAPEINVDIQDCTFTGPQIGGNNIMFTNCVASNSIFDFQADDNQITNTNFYESTVNFTGATNSITCSTFDNCVVGMGGNNSQVSDSTIMEGAVLNLALGSSLSNGYMAASSTMNLLDSNTFSIVNVGQGKVVNPPAGYGATNASIEDYDSTFEVFIDPDISGVLDMLNYEFGGIIRVGNSGIPASWDLKQITNYPTDHIFTIIPSNNNTMDVYDAGVVGGVNIYMNVAAVTTYDGTKDNTLVVRSGLNDATRVFQIGGWIAPSA